MTMRIRFVVIFVAVALASVAIGGGVGYRLANDEVQTLKQGNLVVATALRITDFRNRIVMLRALREKGMSANEIADFELSAVSLLQSIDLVESTENPDTRFVLSKAAELLYSYMKDYPLTEFDPGRRTSVAKLLTFATRAGAEAR